MLFKVGSRVADAAHMNNPQQIRSRPPHWAMRLEKASGSEEQARTLATLAWYQEQRRAAEAQALSVGRAD